MILDKKRIIIKNSKSSIAFQTKGDVGEFWDRYLTVNGKKIYHIGNVCETCRFFFEHLEDATQNELAQDVSDQLNQGLTTIEPHLLDILQMMMPNGVYYVILSTAIPTLVSPGQPEDYFTQEQFDFTGSYYHNPKTDYYRLHTATMPDGCAFFEFLIPLFPIAQLNQERIDYYTHVLAQGSMPTAVTLSILDVHNPFDVENLPIQGHRCLAHYLIDGHHKAYAAAIAKKPLTIISFIAIDKGVSDAAELVECIELLQTVS